MIGRLRSPGVARAVVWASTLVLIAGVVAFVTVRLGQDDSGPANVGSVPGGFASEDFDPNATVSTPKESDVPKAARVAALSDDQVREIAGHLDQLPAGQSAVAAVVGAILIIFLVLLVTDLLGLTNIFPFVNHPK